MSQVNPTSNDFTHNLESGDLGRHLAPLGACDILEHLVTHVRDEALLLIRIGADGDRGQEAPYGLVVEIDVWPERVDARRGLA